MMTLRLAQMLAITGGCTDSVFPKVDEVLSVTEAQEALEYVASRKDMNRYHSMVDFLFCELFVQYRYACFKFYKEEGKLLKDMVAPDLLPAFEKMLLHALTIARKAMEEDREKRYQNWSYFRSEVFKEAA